MAVILNELSLNVGGIKMKNPVLVASGTFGYGEELAKYIDLNKPGAIITKTITLKQREGNNPPRLVETTAGILNSIGLQNVGIDTFIKEKLPFLRKVNTNVIVSIAGFSSYEYSELAKRLNDCKGIAGLELNISCPNVKNKIFSQDSKLTFEVVNRVRKSTRLSIITKLSPNVTDIRTIAKSSEDAGTDAISLVNTFFGMSIDIKTRKSKLANIYGGLSGPAIKPIALYLVWRVYNTVKVPIIGIGGIMNSDDAIEFILTGATAVAIGTANFINPKVSLEVISGMKNYMKRFKIKKITSIIGTLKSHVF